MFALQTSFKSVLLKGAGVHGEGVVVKSVHRGDSKEENS
jgi:hypothetical protein